MAAGGAERVQAVAGEQSDGGGDRLNALGAAMGRGMASELGAAGFRLNSLQIVGASPMAAADIVRITGLV
ncbi:MAG: cell division protein FtsQ, partial [Brevundimonas sp.]